MPTVADAKAAFGIQDLTDNSVNQAPEINKKGFDDYFGSETSGFWGFLTYLNPINWVEYILSEQFTSMASRISEKIFGPILAAVDGFLLKNLADQANPEKTELAQMIVDENTSPVLGLASQLGEDPQAIMQRLQRNFGGSGIISDHIGSVVSGLFGDETAQSHEQIAQDYSKAVLTSLIEAGAINFNDPAEMEATYRAIGFYTDHNGQLKHMTPNMDGYAQSLTSQLIEKQKGNLAGNLVIANIENIKASIANQYVDIGVATAAATPSQGANIDPATNVSPNATPAVPGANGQMVPMG